MYLGASKVVTKKIKTMGIKPGPKRIAKSTGKPDKRQRDNKQTPGNTPSLKPHLHKKRGTNYPHHKGNQRISSQRHTLQEMSNDGTCPRKTDGAAKKSEPHSKLRCEARSYNLYYPPRPCDITSCPIRIFSTCSSNAQYLLFNAPRPFRTARGRTFLTTSQ